VPVPARRQPVASCRARQTRRAGNVAAFWSVQLNTDDTGVLEREDVSSKSSLETKGLSAPSLLLARPVLRKKKRRLCPTQ